MQNMDLRRFLQVLYGQWNKKYTDLTNGGTMPMRGEKIL